MKAVQMPLPLKFETRRLLRCSMPRPENDLHHLHFDPKKGWVCRLTVSVERNGKFAGKRVKLPPWGKIPEAMAIAKRDAVIAGYRKLGLRVETRILVRGVRRDSAGE